LPEWIERVFGGVEIEHSIHEVGHTVEGVWRPGLYFADELLHGLRNTEIDRRLAEQALRILIQRLDEILVYIEPTAKGLGAFGHKTRELLILACTEVENNWKHYVQRAGLLPANGYMFTTKDYAKLLEPLHLEEFEIGLPLYIEVNAVRPFQGWDMNKATQSLPWYDAYNKTKHDRSTHFDLATLQNCIKAVAAALILFCVRFSPFPLLHGVTGLTTLSNQMFSIKLYGCPKSFYVPLIELHPNQMAEIACYDSKRSVQPMVVQSLTI
jgi:hypothetical protein